MGNENALLTAEETAQDREMLQKSIKRAEKDMKGFRFLMLRLVLLALAIWVLFFVFLGVVSVPNPDMAPRVDAGDMALFYRLDKDVRAQDVIVIKKAPPESNGEKGLYVLRVVAVEGDTVEIRNGGLFVNNNLMIENNIFYQTEAYEAYTKYPMTLEPGQCFVLADKRSGGTDSRYFGAVDKSEILGTVITIMRRNNL